jgi:hypothetical protein
MPKSLARLQEREGARRVAAGRVRVLNLARVKLRSAWYYPPTERLITKAQRHEVASKGLSSCYPSWLCAFVVNLFPFARQAVGQLLLPSERRPFLHRFAMLKPPPNHNPPQGRGDLGTYQKTFISLRGFEDPKFGRLGNRVPRG